ncbi:MAG: flagellin-like protein [Lachnospiraceae bacterium]|nr:flagellin-like protein [Lachnospiraceae bacterium]
MMNFLQYFGTEARVLFAKFFREENGEVNIVATVVLIGVAVLLAVVFKDAIGSLLTTLLDTIQTNAENVVNETITTP